MAALSLPTHEPKFGTHDGDDGSEIVVDGSDGGEIFVDGVEVMEAKL